LILKKRLRLQGFGKLPFYKDYISIVSSPEALEWRDWLLDIFGEKNRRVPGGAWPFIFRPSPGSGVAVGMIMPGTDGVREFPFSLFSVLKYKGVEARGAIPRIWDDLKAALNDLDGIEDIDACHFLIRSRSLSMDWKNESGDGGPNRFCDRLLFGDHARPLFMAFPDLSGSGALVYDGGSADTFLKAWKGLRDHA
jgi:hypothetical protein